MLAGNAKSIYSCQESRSDVFRWHSRSGGGSRRRDRRLRLARRVPPSLRGSIGLTLRTPAPGRLVKSQGMTSLARPYAAFLPRGPSPAGLHSTGRSAAREEAEDMTAAAAGVACAAWIMFVLTRRTFSRGRFVKSQGMTSSARPRPRGPGRRARSARSRRPSASERVRRPSRRAASVSAAGCARLRRARQPAGRSVSVHSGTS